VATSIISSRAISVAVGRAAHIVLLIKDRSGTRDEYDAVIVWPASLMDARRATKQNTAAAAADTAENN